MSALGSSVLSEFAQNVGFGAGAVLFVAGVLGWLWDCWRSRKNLPRTEGLSEYDLHRERLRAERDHKTEIDQKNAAIMKEAWDAGWANSRQKDEP